MAKSNTEDLDKIAAGVAAKQAEKRAQAKKKPTPAPEPEPVVDDSIITDDIDDTEADEIIDESENAPVGTISQAKPAGAVKAITKDDLMAMLPNLPHAEKEKRASDMLVNLDAYKKKIIIENGLTDEEANQAVHRRASRNARDIDNEWVEAHPASAVISIEKGKEDNLGLTNEEHAKLVTTTSIRLNLIENRDVSSMKIRTVPQGISRLEYIRQLGTTATHSIPLPGMGDYCTFRGATSAEIVGSHLGDEGTVRENIDHIMTFIYDHYVSGNLIKKYDESGRIVVTYDQFRSTFPYFDADLALLAIALASTTDDPIHLDTRCPKCGQSFHWSFNPHRLFTTDSLSGWSRDKANEILAHKNDPAWLLDHAAKATDATLYESPVTKNRFLVQYPSAARVATVIDAAERMNLDAENALDSAVTSDATLLREMWIYDPSSDSYIHFEEGDIEDILRALPLLHEADFGLLHRFGRDVYYDLDMEVKGVRCTNCGDTRPYVITPTDILFSRARESFQETLSVDI